MPRLRLVSPVHWVEGAKRGPRRMKVPGCASPRSARWRPARGALALALAAALLLAGNALAAPGGSAATITGSFADACRDFAARSSKDISHVVIRYADGRVVKDESTTTPDYAIDGGPGDEIDSVEVKSGTTTESFACTATNSPPTAILELQTPPDCVLVFPSHDAWGCGWVTTPRTSWLSAAAVGFGCPDDIAGPCELTFRFRGTGSSDPDNDITSWSIEFVNTFNGTVVSASGDWATNPPTEVTLILPPERVLYGSATLTVTDAAGQSASDTMTLEVHPPD